MGVPSTISDLNVSAASNSPAGSDTVATNTGPDEYIRALASIIKREQSQFTATASATTVDLGAIATGSYGHITGTTTITGFGTVAAGIERTVVFDGALTLTHNATSLILPGGANITTAAGDIATFRSEGSGNWRCISYVKASGAPVGSYQPLDALLTALAGQTTAAAKVQGYSGADAVTLYDFKDEDNMASNSDTAVPSQQSVKAYVDTQVAASQEIKQIVSTATSAVATGATTTPLDDTIPQNTEGTEFITLAITPTSAASTLHISGSIVVSSQNNAHVIAALFQDTTADAIAAAAEYVSTANGTTTINVEHYMTAGTTSATTFKIRVGANVASTITFNGNNGGRIFGAITKSSMSITEISA